MKTNDILYLSPSVYHRNLLSKTVPSLAYDHGDVKKWQTRLRKKLRQLLGEMPKNRCPLNPRRLWERTHPFGTIEKIAFTAEPYADVVAYVCLPKLTKPPYTFIICLQGHTTGMHQSIAFQQEDETLPLKVDGDRDFALGCMSRGIAALCIEQRAFGERREQTQKVRSPNGCLDATLQALMLGKTLIGERVFDVDRGIDYLASRGDVRMNLIGVMGNSSGGAMSMYSAALLPRIAYAVPSCYFCTFKDSVMAMNHCEENYIPGLLQQAEMVDIMGLIAPRPVVIIAGLKDHLFPIKATRSAFKDLQRIYTAAGAPKQCHLVVGREGHRFYADDAWPVMLKVINRLTDKH